LGGGRGEELLEAGLARLAVGELLDELGTLLEAHLPPGDRGPVPLLVLVEVARVDALPLALDDRETSPDVGRDRDEPRRGRELAPRAAVRPTAGRGCHAGALTVEVGAEQRVQRDDAVVVRRALVHEVD